MSSHYYFSAFHIISFVISLYLNNTMKFLESTQSFLLPFYLLCFMETETALLFPGQPDPNNHIETILITALYVQWFRYISSLVLHFY